MGDPPSRARTPHARAVAVMSARVSRARAALWTAGRPVRTALVLLIRLYRVTLGGMLGGQCRFHPSCSVYAEEAISRLGVMRAVPLAAWRILRCSPLST